VRAGDASYLPTRVPLGYRYERWQQSGGKLVVTFKHGSSANRFRFEVERLPRGMACDLPGSFLRTLQTDGNKVYHRGEAGEWIASCTCVNAAGRENPSLAGTIFRRP
jgi:hypothetical protein